MKISMIVPVYNVKEYLPDCLKSIEDQTYQDFELILVDDGSTDGSGEICDNYARTHNNTIVVHQKNQGLSMTRNNGVKKSTGEYITFVDSDDYISSDYLFFLVDQVKKTKADIAVGKSLIVWETHEIKNRNLNTDYKIYNTEEALIQMMYEKEFLCVACSKIYRRSMILEHPYPTGVLFEDLATSYKIFGEASTVSVGNEYIYFWRHRKDSISKQKINEKHIQSLEFAQKQIDYMIEHFPKAVNAAKYKYVAKIVSLVPYTFSRDDESKEYFNLLREKIEIYAPTVLKDNEARSDIRIRCQAIRKGYLSAKVVLGFVEFIKPFRSRNQLKKRGLI